MNIPEWAWAAILAALVVASGADMLLGARSRRPESMRAAVTGAAVTVVAAVGFGALLALAEGGTAAGQFYAGWLTEYSLSLDNLLVFALLIGHSGVPRAAHGRVLTLGIMLALLLRGALIVAGAAALHRFGWVQYVFGTFLLGTGVMMWRGRSHGGQARDRRVALASRWLGSAAPVLALIAAIAVADVVFAVDSIPAIFGLTRNPVIVFAANVFALAGLRHLYFLLHGLLDRLVHLSAGAAAVVVFIGAKLITEALRSSGVDHLGPVAIPHVGAALSLMVIAALLGLAAVFSLAAPAGGGNWPTRLAAGRRGERWRRRWRP